MGEVLKITSKMWKSDLNSEECFSGIKTTGIGEPEVLFACSKFWDGTPVDELSFADIEREWREIFFGKAGAELPPGELIAVGDRTGALFRPRDGENPIRLLVAPYDGGLMATWLRGSGADVAAADAAMMAMASTVKFTGPDGGQPLIRPVPLGQLLPDPSPHASVCPGADAADHRRDCGLGPTGPRKEPLRRL